MVRTDNAKIAASALLALAGLFPSSDLRAQVAERQLLLKQAAEARVAKGEVPPPRGKDSGSPIMQCLGIQPVPTHISAEVLRAIGGEMVLMFEMLVGTRSVQCANSEEGARVLAYREWYCNGKDATCVLSAWNGEPSLTAPPEQGVSFDVGASAPGGNPGVKVKLTLAPVYK